MGKVRRKVERLERPTRFRFDETLWPVTLALLALAGYVAYLIIRVSEFNHPLPWRNTAVLLTTLGFTVVGLLWGVSRLPRRQHRRIQAATFASLLIHLAILDQLGLLFLRLPLPNSIADVRPSIPQPRPDETFQPQLVQERERREIPIWETPVETAEASRDATNDDGPAGSLNPSGADAPQVALSESAQEAEREPSPSMPRRAEELAKFSRSETSSQAEIALPAPSHANESPAERSLERTELADAPAPQPDATSPAEGASAPSLSAMEATPRSETATATRAKVMIERADDRSSRSLVAAADVIDEQVAAETPATAGLSRDAPSSAEPSSRMAESLTATDSAQPTLAAAELFRQEVDERVPSPRREPVVNPRNSAAAQPPVAVAQVAPAPQSTDTPSESRISRTSPMAEASAGVSLPARDTTSATRIEVASALTDSVARTRYENSGAAPSRSANAPTPRSRWANASPENGQAELVAQVGGEGGDGSASDSAQLVRVASPSDTAANRASKSAAPSLAAASNPDITGAAGIAQAPPRNDRPSTSSIVGQAASVGSRSTPGRHATGVGSVDELPTLAQANDDSGIGTGAASVARAAGEAGGVPSRGVESTADGESASLVLSLAAASGRASRAESATSGPVPGSRQRGGGPTLARSRTGPSTTASGTADLDGTGVPSPSAGDAGGDTSATPTLARSGAGASVSRGSETSSFGNAAATPTIAGIGKIGPVSRTESSPGVRAIAQSEQGIPRAAPSSNRLAPASTIGDPSVGIPTSAEAPAQGTGALSRGSTGGEIEPAASRAPSFAQASTGMAPEIGVNRTPGVPHREALMEESSNGPSAATRSVAGLGRQRSATTSAASPSGMADLPAEFAQASGASTLGDGVTPTTGGGTSLESFQRSAANSVSRAIDIDATLDAGGLGPRPSLDIGAPLRLARRESESLAAVPSRFLIRTPTTNLGGHRIRSRSDAFQGRDRARHDSIAASADPIAVSTERAVERGLAFLARVQSPDGHWSLHDYEPNRRAGSVETSQLRSDTGGTGLALLAFLGAGYDHYEPKYRGVVKHAIDYLRAHQKDDGDLYVPMDQESNQSAWLYSHAIASMALCEAYGMTGDEELRAPAQKAIDFILAAQEKNLGGWRYSPGRETDTSVTGWMLMALKSAELSGLDVDPTAYDRIRAWLELAQGDRQSEYVYNPYNAVERGRQPSATMNAVGLLMRLYLGWNRDHPGMKEGGHALQQNPPRLGSRLRPLRDTYYWYYGTLVMFHMQGEYWETWNGTLHPLLVESQVSSGVYAGSWDPLGTIMDRWGRHAGRIYVTSMNLLSLEVYYRHLPLYESTGR